jgi:hypothetical protein
MDATTELRPPPGERVFSAHPRWRDEKAEIERLQELLRGTGAWRTVAKKQEAEIERLSREKNVAAAMLESAEKECRELRTILQRVRDDIGFDDLSNEAQAAVSKQTISEDYGEDLLGLSPRDEH